MGGPTCLCSMPVLCSHLTPLSLCLLCPFLFMQAVGGGAKLFVLCACAVFSPDSPFPLSSLPLFFHCRLSMGGPSCLYSVPVLCFYLTLLFPLSSLKCDIMFVMWCLWCYLMCCGVVRRDSMWCNVCMYVCLYVCIYLCIYVSMYVCVSFESVLCVNQHQNQHPLQHHMLHKAISTNVM
jgi:hypothetical protein